MTGVQTCALPIYYLLALPLPILLHGIIDFFPLAQEYLPKDKETIDALTSLPYATDNLILTMGHRINQIVILLAVLYIFWKIHKWSRNGELQESIRA